MSLDATPYYHCICRCVGRAFLCGQDSFTGQNYEHRKEWVIERLRELQSVFSVDVCAYAMGLEQTAAEKAQAQRLIGQWRERLSNLSWYMRSLNELHRPVLGGAVQKPGATR